MNGHREVEVGTCMDTERVRWVHIWTQGGDPVHREVIPSTGR